MTLHKIPQVRFLFFYGKSGVFFPKKEPQWLSELIASPTQLAALAGILPEAETVNRVIQCTMTFIFTLP